MQEVVGADGRCQVTRALRIVRAMAAEGRHLNRCMAGAEARNEGWRLLMCAKRTARRLGYSLRALGVDL